MQVMLHIKDIALRNMRISPNRDPQWDRVLREAAHAGAPYKTELGGLIEYVKQLSGGLQTPRLLDDLQQFMSERHRLEKNSPLYTVGKKCTDKRVCGDWKME